MARSQTAWSNSTRNTDAWAVAARTATTWGNEAGFPASYTYSDASLTYNSATQPYNYITAVPPNELNNRNPTTWVGATETSTSWSNESVSQVGYLYDSSALYDSAYTYDFTTFVANQSNNKNAVTWAVVV